MSQEHDDISVPIHRSLTRPMLMLGGEREFVLALATLAGVFIFSLAQLWAALLGVALWLIGMFFMVRAGRYDPQLSKTGIRSLRYKRIYSSESTPFAPVREVK
ncbi:conjugal transfer protein TrbD [Azonexus sp.]|uniref:conjugal transfer protein TrbD n=1 Tax=Azonexus sp. TaxID=1872668 RepID=UPI0039E6000E